MNLIYYLINCLLVTNEKREKQLLRQCGKLGSTLGFPVGDGGPQIRGMAHVRYILTEANTDLRETSDQQDDVCPIVEVWRVLQP